MNNIIIETERLILRKISNDDYLDIANILQDSEVMYAWEKTFSDEEVSNWIEENLKGYKRDGYSYFLAIDKKYNEVVGVMGPLIEIINNKSFIGVAYILNKNFWGKGYATEGVKGCIDYTFKNLNAKSVIAQIRTCNKSSQKVVERLNLQVIYKYIRIYDNKEMEHLVYSIDRNRYYAKD
ncbi:GNAT family N-acetyltransferase [Clostridium fallax]|uniref:Protein N-acetyltransferase, RimJ/RimL family n=1 Tax=Clostridium fallax TaxID=1533 RepID=A0A1M4YUM8_9CLOT|nr:GNAT family N-acetyltransferase [Clostridium fallax]SHF09287.1 Protein N-acetyltransferase, RimJ/RimL family [Clostridium fallax]SQB22180.1 GNAT family acetyltransferase [Clostridium fallax]